MNNSKRRLPAAAGILLGTAVVVLAVGIVVQRGAASRLTRQIFEEKLAISKARRSSENCTSWQAEYNKLSLKLGGRLRRCSWSEQMPFMVAQLTGIVESHSLKIETLQPEPMSSSKGIARFPLRVGLQAGLRDLTDILRDIKGAVPLLDIEQLDVRSVQGASEKLHVDMTISSFVVLDKQAPLAKRRAVRVAEKEEVAEVNDERD